jgi:hypothetical protein
MQGDDYEAQYIQIQRFLAPWSPAKIALDYTGVGVALGDRVMAFFDYAEVETIPFSLQSKDSMGRVFLSDILRGLITWPGNPEYTPTPVFRAFRTQMLDLEKEYKTGGFLSLHHPDMRGAKDDFCDSAILACYAASTRPYGGEVDSIDENIYKA